VKTRSGLVFQGPQGCGEFAPFKHHSPEHAALWLKAAIEMAYNPVLGGQRFDIPANGIVPMMDLAEIPDYVRLVLSQGVKSFKVKCGSEDFADDFARVMAVREAAPLASIRIDANGKWNVQQAKDRIFELNAFATLEYVEQPVATLQEMQQLRNLVDVPLAVDENIRLSSEFNPKDFQMAADIAILKAIPSGGVRDALEIAEKIAMPIVVSGSMDTSVGLVASLQLAANVDELYGACGLETDIAETLLPSKGRIELQEAKPNGKLLEKSAWLMSREEKDFWENYLVNCYEILEQM
jgi:O-succinylbenzoate synthase